MARYITIYMILGAILSVLMYLTSKKPLPIKAEIAAHLTIALLWPVILIRVLRLFFMDQKDLDEYCRYIEENRE